MEFSVPEAVIRFRQGFGRLIRTREDAGHFVVLSSAFPSRFLSAFPDGTPVLRLTLAEALQRVAQGVHAVPGGETAKESKESA